MDGWIDMPPHPAPPFPCLASTSAPQIRWHVRLELALLKRYWPWVALAVGAEYMHLVAHNLVYYMEGIYYPDGPPPPLKDLGLMLLADRMPGNFGWVVGALTCTLVAMVLLLGLARITLKNVPWGGPQLEVVGHGDPTGSGRPRTVVAVRGCFVCVCVYVCAGESVGVSVGFTGTRGTHLT